MKVLNLSLFSVCQCVGGVILLQWPFGYLLAYGALFGIFYHLIKACHLNEQFLLEFGQFISLDRFVSLKLQCLGNIFELICTNRLTSKCILELFCGNEINQRSDTYFLPYPITQFQRLMGILKRFYRSLYSPFIEELAQRVTFLYLLGLLQSMDAQRATDSLETPV